MPAELTDDGRNVMRQAFAGMLWCKQYYHYVVDDWLNGDPRQPAAADERRDGPQPRLAPPLQRRRHLDARQVGVPVVRGVGSRVPLHCRWRWSTPSSPRSSSMLLLREWYMHPNGQIPAYEWAFGDVNPPVHAWAALRVYQIEQKRPRRGRSAVPRARLPQAAAELHLVGQPQGRRGQQHLSGRLPRARQHRRLRSQRAAARAAATSSSRTARAGWRCTASTCSRIALELAREDPAYEDVASKFWEHFLYIAHAMNNRGDGVGLWDEEDGFFYDVLHTPDGQRIPLQGALDGRADSALRGRDARADAARAAARLHAAAGVVHRATVPT